VNLRSRSSESWDSFSFFAAETPWATPMVVGRAVRRRENIPGEGLRADWWGLEGDGWGRGRGRFEMIGSGAAKG